jgi:Sulfatase
MRFALFLALLPAFTLLAQDGPSTRNLILVTADGLRWQEVFQGIDPLLARERSAGMERAGDRLAKYERPSERERREALMPFFWTKLAPRGMVFRDVRVTNGIRASYPGYSEILTGRSEDRLIHSNLPIQNPNETVLEFLKRKLALDRKQVALFASWQTFREIAEHNEGAIYINAGYQAIDDPHASAAMSELSRLQFHALTPWPEARHDYITGAMALEYMAAEKPRVLCISFDETDDWAHDRRYDRVLDAIAEFDSFLERLTNAIESLKEYRGQTTVIITTDHGRGGTPADWFDHGRGVAGADRIWLAMTGPDTPTGVESTANVEQRDIAPTMIKLTGLNANEYQGATGKPIAAAVKESARR